MLGSQGLHPNCSSGPEHGAFKPMTAISGVFCHPRTQRRDISCLLVCAHCVGGGENRSLDMDNDNTHWVGMTAFQCTKHCNQYG